MGKKSKQKKEVILHNKMLFSVNNLDYSGNANKHNARMIRTLLTDLDINFKIFSYSHSGILDTAFQVDMKHKEVVKELCKKFNIEHCLSLYQDQSGRYAVYKEEVDTKRASCLGYLEGKTKTECQGESYYFFDEMGHYFTLGRKGTIIEVPETKEVA